MGKIQRTDRQLYTLSRSFRLKHLLKVSAYALAIPAIIHSATAFSAINAGGIPSPADIAPEAASSINAQLKSAHSARQMVVTANPYATEAALSILAQDGSAVDAAIAAQLILGLVEPQSSGLGGGGFLLHFDKENNKLSHFDGRETAPEAIDDKHFLTKNGDRLDFFDAVVGGYSVGTPGLLAMMYHAHQQYGKLAWSQLFNPAIKLAQQGFTVSPRLHILLNHLSELPYGEASSDFKTYFFDQNGQPRPIGSSIKNPAYAQTLTALATKGIAPFYQGSIAKSIIAAVQNNPRRPGKLQLSDLKNYRPIENNALCKVIGDYKLCGAPPPSSGAFTIIQQIAMLYALPSAQGIAYNSVAFYHRFSESSKLAFADRNRYIADPRFINIPLKKLLADDYLASRSQQIPLLQASNERAKAGQLANNAFITSTSSELPSTTHLSIVDDSGNIVSMTSSIEAAFGSRIMVNGFILNNQLTDFSFIPKHNDQRVANRIQAGKRPRSSMAPMIIFKNDRPVLVLGSPGGSRIINYVAKVIYQHLYLGSGLGQAIQSAHLSNLNRIDELEKGHSQSPGLEKSLLSLGHTLKIIDQTSGLHAISINPSQLIGIADPRREGSARSE